MAGNKSLQNTNKQNKETIYNFIKYYYNVKNYKHNLWLKGRQKNHIECMNMNEKEPKAFIFNVS